MEKVVMDDAWTNTIIQKARSSATRRGYPELAEDFTQWAIVKFLEGKRQHSTLDQMLIDYLRETKGHPTRNKLEYAMGYSLDLFNKDGEDNYYSTGFDVHNMDFKLITEGLDTQGRAIIVLYYKWQFELTEIGEVLGVTDSRISQVLKETKNLLSKRHGNA